MPKVTNKKSHNPGKMPKFFNFMCHLHKTNPDAFDDPAFLRAVTSRKWDGLNNETRCPNCDANMLEMVFKFDIHNAVLLQKIGEAVRSKLANGLIFTEANKVHVISTHIPDSLRHRTTQTAKLGLIAKVKKDGKHVREEGWLVTKRGFEALRGMYVPEEVRVWRGEIVGRSKKNTTIDQVFSEYRQKIREFQGKGNNPKEDYTADTDRDPADWANFGEVQQGDIF